MRISNLHDVDNALQECLAAVRSDLPIQDVSAVRDFIEAGEEGLAFDTLCTQLYEFDIPVSLFVRNTLKAVGEHMGMDADLWSDLSVSNDEGRRA